MKGSRNTEVPLGACLRAAGGAAGVRCLPKGGLTRSGGEGYVSLRPFSRFHSFKEGSEDACKFQDDPKEMSNLQSLMLIYDFGQVA